MSPPRYAWRELLATVATVGAAILILLPPLRPSSADLSTTASAALSGPISKTQLSHLELPPTGRECRVQRGSLVRGGPTDRKRIALSFDDGPSTFTPSILQTLRRYKAHATFFVNGVWVKSANREHILREELAYGNEIGNHTESHPQLTKLSRKEIDGELDLTQQKIDAATGFMPCLFRPPYGSVDPFVLRQLKRHRFATVAWNVDSLDYERLGSRALANNVLSGARPGAIVLMHDGVIRRQQTVDALPMILRGLRRRHLEPVTVSQLFSPGGRGTAGTRAALAIRAP